MSDELELAPVDGSVDPDQVQHRFSGVLRLACFFGMILVLFFLMNAMITSGLRRTKTSAFGSWNQVMEGKVNADIVVVGSSRASVQYDPRTIEAVTGHSAYNLGINGTQTDMQVAFFKAYLEHNRKPHTVLFNLDAFAFVTSHEVFNPAQYMPYLYDRALYDALRKINPEIWKSRYLPLYGYVVEDMNYTWVHGIEAFFGHSPAEDYFLGFNPRYRSWSSDFERYQAANPKKVSFDIEPAGVADVEDLIQVCKKNGIDLIFIYSPEYKQMQMMTSNRAEIFDHFRKFTEQYNIPMWDYSDWPHDSDTSFFYNSQHLNATGAAAFSLDVADRLRQYLTAQ
ncbi:hypothetical protein [Acidobacterium sp. S8]|uniref:hypothetical protein n=1 Tax=Acidobacterium sp. S8 TaxID=1641854 RepID=UPI00131CAA0F|nr:hypothetical protein [Acidobacterium sp. S8]